MKGLRGQGKNGREKCAPSEIRVTTLLLCNFEIGSVVNFFLLFHTLTLISCSQRCLLKVFPVMRLGCLIR